MRNKLLKLFESGDGRLASQILFVRKGEVVNLISSNWDCDEGEIIVYKFLHYPENQKCEEALIHMWTKDVALCDPLQSAEVPRVKLTRGNMHDIIDEHGQYLLHRAIDAENVQVYAKYAVSP